MNKSMMASSAIEEIGADAIDMASASDTNSTVVPAIDPSSAIAAPTRDLNEEDKVQLFLFMLKKYLGNDRFIEMVNDIAVDMEVYGLINNAETLKSSASCIQKDLSDGRWNVPVQMAALKLAAHENDAAFTRYAEAEKAQQEAMTAIMQEYGSDARTALARMLEDNQRRSMMMNGQCAKSVQYAISDMRDHIKV